jgi:hypothetical protein
MEEMIRRALLEEDDSSTETLGAIEGGMTPAGRVRIKDSVVI